MMQAKLILVSNELLLDQISQTMGCDPDGGTERGEIRRLAGGAFDETTWWLNLVWPDEDHGGTEGLSSAIESLGKILAKRAGVLGEGGCEVVIRVLQNLDADPNTTGLFLSRGAIQWMAIAGASLDVDQYVVT